MNNQKFSQLDKRVDTLSENVDVLKRDVDGLKRDVDVLQQDVDLLKQDVGELRVEIRELKQLVLAEIRDIHRRIDESYAALSAEIKLGFQVSAGFTTKTADYSAEIDRKVAKVMAATVCESKSTVHMETLKELFPKFAIDGHKTSARDSEFDQAIAVVLGRSEQLRIQTEKFDTQRSDDLNGRQQLRLAFALPD